MEKQIKVSEEVVRLISGDSYYETKTRARLSLETLKSEIRDLMNSDVKDRNWQIMTEEEFNIHHEENIVNQKRSLIIAVKTGRWKNPFLFAEGTELKSQFCVRMRMDKMKERNIFDGFDKVRLESKNIILPISEMGKKAGRVVLEMFYFPIKMVENLRPRLRNRG